MIAGWVVCISKFCMKNQIFLVLLPNSTIWSFGKQKSGGQKVFQQSNCQLKLIITIYEFLDNWRQYDFALTRLAVHRTDCWRGISPLNFIDQDPPIYAAKFANCRNERNLIAITNEEGQVK